MNSVYQIRAYKPEDKNFIMATFLRGLYYGDSWFSLMPKDLFMENYKHVGEALIASPNVDIKVACLAEDSDVIIGYSVVSKDQATVHWVFIKQAFRRKGIGKALFSFIPKQATHLTTLGRSLLEKYEMIFNPFALR